MIGVILAAGVGSRLRPITDDKPKSLVRVAGKEMLRYQLDSYKKAGIRDIVVVVGYEGKAISEYLKHEKQFDITIIWNVDYEHTNNMYSLYLAKKAIDGRPFILNNADLAIDKAIVPLLVNNDEEDLIAVDKGTFDAESMKIQVDAHQCIHGISKQISADQSFGCSIDFYKFSAASCQQLFATITHIIEVAQQPKDWTELAIDQLLKDGKISMKPLPINGNRWVEVDNFDDLAAADHLFADIPEKLAHTDVVFCDLDGTLYTGDQRIDGAETFIHDIRAAGKKLYVLSNNSSKSKQQYVDKLAEMDIHIDKAQILLSTDGLIHYLVEQHVHDVYTVGTQALKDQLTEAGIQADSDHPEFVVVGYDSELNYHKLEKACYFLNQSVDMLATHPDVFCPTPTGPIPDCGAIVSMLTHTTGVKPLQVFGKPDTGPLRDTLKQLNIPPSRAAVIGDRLYTDMQLARQLGCTSILVLSGETHRTTVEEERLFPDICAQSVASLVE